MQNYDAPSAGIAAAIFGAVLIPSIIIWVITAAGMWKTFDKAGKPGWAAIIPIYNVIVLLEIVGKPVWWIILFLIPCVNFIFAIWTINLLSKSYGQGVGFTIGLLILPFIFYPVLGFGNYPYLGPAGLGNFNAYDPGKDYQDPFNNPTQQL